MISTRIPNLFLKYLLMPPHITTPNHQNIPLSQRRTLPLQRLFQLLHRNLMPRHWTWRLAILLLIPPQPIAQHAPAHDPTLLAPIVRAVRMRRARLLVRKSVVVTPAGLVGKVL